MRTYKTFTCPKCNGNMEIVNLQSLHFLLKCKTCGFERCEQPTDVEIESHAWDGLDVDQPIPKMREMLSDDKAFKREMEN
jgi:transcription elongation factor Elf1